MRTTRLKSCRDAANAPVTAGLHFARSLEMADSSGRIWDDAEGRAGRETPENVVSVGDDDLRGDVPLGDAFLVEEFA
jgi:hypothetical protein